MNKKFVQKIFSLSKRKKIILISGLSLLLLVVISLGCFLYYFRAYMYTPVSENQNEITFTIEKGESVREIASDLESKELLKDDFLFLVYLKIKGLSGQLIAGDYLIRQDITPLQLIDTFTSGRIASIKITIPEGWTNDRIADYLNEKGIVTKEDFLTATKKSYDYPFLAQKPADKDLEGFLFPDTYQLSYKVTADQIVQKMLENFQKKVDTPLSKEISAAGLEYYDLLKLASIVEREVAKPEDRKVVAGIFLSRLDEGMPLESCATIQYILKVNKTQFTYDETRTPSLYNTYLNPGLPAGPIGNPGLESIKAVIYPTITEFRYFLSADGTTYFSKTFAEHEEKKVKYL